MFSVVNSDDCPCQGSLTLHGHYFNGYYSRTLLGDERPAPGLNGALDPIELRQSTYALGDKLSESWLERVDSLFLKAGFY